MHDRLLLQFNLAASLCQFNPDRWTSHSCAAPITTSLGRRRAGGGSIAAARYHRLHSRPTRPGTAGGRRALDRAADHNFSIVIGKLAHLLWSLNPGHAGTEALLAEIRPTIDNVSPHRLFAPSTQTSAEPQIVTGTVAQLRPAPGKRLLLFDDACLSVQALESGSVLVSRYIADTDLIGRRDADPARASPVLRSHARLRRHARQQRGEPAGGQLTIGSCSRPVSVTGKAAGDFQGGVQEKPPGKISYTVHVGSSARRSKSRLGTASCRAFLLRPAGPPSSWE